MSNSYNTRSSFSIAENDELDIKLFGMWYRHDAMEYIVMAAGQNITRFTKLSNALEYFERLTAAPVEPVTSIDVTSEEDEAFQALSTAPVSSSSHSPSVV